MITPLFYQDDCLRAIARVRQKAIQIALVVMASGLGKTVTAAFDVLAFRKKIPKARVLYLCHQNHILSQAAGKFEAIHGNDCTYGFYNSVSKSAHKVDFLFASLQTMRKNMHKFDPTEFDYVVVDESHRTHADTYLDVVMYWKPKFLLGMTATPDRTDGQDIRTVFGKEIFFLPLEEALAQSLLTPVDYRLMSDEIELKELLRTPERRYSVAQLNRRVFVPKRDEQIVAIIRKHTESIQNPRTIVFCRNIKHCDQMAKHIKGSMTFHSEVPDADRIVRLEMFRQGIISTLVTVDVFNEGIDIPEANVLVFLRSTISPIIFLQQLGRGLRLCEGKDRVIVLDFVGNCERVKTVYELWSRVKYKRSLANKTVVAKVQRRTVSFGEPISLSSSEPFSLNTDSVQFKEKVLKLVDILRRITDGYSRDECIAMLRLFAQKIGRSPTQREVQKEKIGMPSMSLIEGYFGRYSNFLKAAGLPVNQILDVSDDELLDQLRSLEKKLGHSPSQREVAAASKQGICSCEPIFRKRFGSINKALEKIGSKPGRYVNLTEKELCLQLVKLKERLGRVPTITDLAASAANDEMASYSLFYKKFGSWNAALLKAGLTNKVREVQHHSDAELIADLQKARTILGRNPTAADILKLGAAGKIKVTTIGVFYSRFKNWAKVLEVAGLK